MTLSRLRPAVFLDRDGVINSMVRLNGEWDSPLRAEHVKLLPRAAEAIRRLNEAGLPVIVVSNQPAVAKRKTTHAELKCITERIQQELCAAGGTLDAVYYCLHHPQAAEDELRAVCNCRKPAPGLLMRAAADHQLDLSCSSMVGDRLTDIRAGKEAKCRTILLDGIDRRASDEDGTQPDHHARDLYEAVSWIVSTI